MFCFGGCQSAQNMRRRTSKTTGKIARYSDSLLSVVFMGVMHEKVSSLLLSRFLPRLKSSMGERGEGRKEDKAKRKGVESDLP